jgi:hypothetical protein
MKSRKGPEERFWAILGKAYRNRTPEPAPPGWSEEVIRRISGCRMEIAGPETVWPEYLVWRFASAACLLAVMLVLLAAGLGLRPESHWVQFLIGDPVGLDINPLGLINGGGERL